MSTPFGKKKLDCNAKEMIDALTVIHDLGFWDDYVFNYAIEDPEGFCRKVQEDRDDLLAQFEKSRRGNATEIIWKNYGGMFKIPAIKIYREFSESGLADAKGFIESLPKKLPFIYPTLEDAENAAFIKVAMRELGLGGLVRSWFDFVPYEGDSSYHADIIFYESLSHSAIHKYGLNRYLTDKKIRVRAYR